MLTTFLCIASLALCLAAWTGMRRAVGARPGPVGLLALDAAPVLLSWICLVSLSGRPVFGALLVCGTTFGLLQGNRVKIAATGEPLVHMDWLMTQVMFFPELYSELAKPQQIVLATTTALAVASAAWIAEPRLWSGFWPAATVLASLLILSRWRPKGRTLLVLLGGARALRLTGDAAGDMRRFGPLAAPTIQAATAAAEREARRSLGLPGQSSLLPELRPNGKPVVLLQLESFFDVRTLGVPTPAGLLAQYDRCIAGAIRHGQITVPAFGANTVRTEFQALTGMTDALLGPDCYNPYARFARMPVDSIAWRLRHAGYRTICVHPYHGGFYGRRKVLPNLGFDTFHDIDAFRSAARSGPYVSDTALAAKVGELLEAHGPRTFIFAISMGNHGPWRMRDPSVPGSGRGSPFAGYLRGLQDTDEALGLLAELMQRRWPNGLLAAFGDHRPAFNQLYDRLGSVDRSTPYFMLRPTSAPGVRQDRAVSDLPAMMLRETAVRLLPALTA